MKYLLVTTLYPFIQNIISSIELEDKNSLKKIRQKGRQG